MPLTDRTVTRSISLLLAVGFLSLLAIVGMTVWLGHRFNEYSEDVRVARSIRVSAVELRHAIVTAESSQRGYIATSNEIYLAPYRSAKSQAVRQLDILKRNLSPFPESENAVQRLSALVNQKIIEMDNTIALKVERRDADVMAALRTNRGKALTDEANVFLTGILLRADERLTALSNEQTENAHRLRFISILGSIIVIIVVSTVLFTILRYTRQVAAARDQVRMLNVGLEERVAQRTSELEKARDRAQVLLSEVNHRVANSLSMVASLVKLQTKAVTDKSATDALRETEARIQAIASVHKRLYTSGDVRSVALDEYLSNVLDHLGKSLRDAGSGATLTYELGPLTLQTDQSVNLGVVATELVTNAFKYAYPDRPGEVRVRLRRVEDADVELLVEDDGVGRSAARSASGTGLGDRIISAMATSMNAKIEYSDGRPGTTARLTFPLKR